MSVFIQDPEERGAVTFADATPDRLGALGSLPSVWLARQYVGLGSDLMDEDRRAAMGALYRSADDMQHFVDNTFAREDAATEAYRRRIEKIHEATGVQLRNPMETARTAAVAGFGQVLDPFGATESLETDAARELRDFNEQLADLKAQYPQHAALFDQNFAPEIATLVQDTDRQRREAEAGGEDLTGLSSIGAGFAGAARGMLRDPLQVATLFFGAVPSASRTVAARIGQTALQEGVINAGVETAVQTRAQAWRAENGLESGVLPALKQIGLTGLFGGAFGGLIAGGREIARAMRVTDPAERAAFERLATGEATAADYRRVAERMGLTPDELEARTLDVARAQNGLDDAAFGDVPAGLTREEWTIVRREAVAAVEEEKLPTFAPVRKPKRNVEEDAVLFETAQAPDSFQMKFGKAGPRSVTKATFDPDTVGTDAASYQYKGGGDEAGVTARLREVKRWDPTASGKVMVHERENGERYIADGHQRLGLAQRLKERGEPGVQLDGFLFRERDGWTAEDVRALAAKKNLQEGSGEAIDAARILRDRPDILDDGLPTTGPMMKKAVNLSRLSDDAWSLTVNGLVDENHAALVGQVMPDPSMHAAAVRELARFQPESDRQARALLDEIVARGVRLETQVDMFGSFDLSHTLIPERVRVLDETLKVLRRDKRVFALLGERADMIEAAGNVLDASGNASRAVTAETVGAVIDRMARTRGPVSDALTESARRVAIDKKPVAGEARAFIDAVQDAIETSGMRALLSPPEPQLAPTRTVEPASREAEELAGELPTAAELEAQGQGGLFGDADLGAPERVSGWDVLPDGTDGQGNPLSATGADLVARAERDGFLSDTLRFCEV